MSRTYVSGSARRWHELAELALTPARRQNISAHNPTINPARLRELAEARRRLAAKQAGHLTRREAAGPIEPTAARWARQSIRNLLAEEAALLAQADELERHAAARIEEH
jgi:hypothetical protein